MGCGCVTGCQLAGGRRVTFCTGPSSWQWERDAREHPEQQLCWAAVQPGDYVRRPGTRRWWLVLPSEPGDPIGYLRLRGDGGATHQGQPNPADPVLILPRREMMGSPTMDDATALVTRVLGAREITT